MVIYYHKRLNGDYVAPSNLVIYSTDRVSAAQLSASSAVKINFSAWSTFDDARRAWPMCNDFDQHDDEALNQMIVHTHGVRLGPHQCRNL